MCSKNPKVQFPTIVGTNDLTGAFHQAKIGNTVEYKLVFALFSHFENTMQKSSTHSASSKVTCHATFMSPYHVKANKEETNDPPRTCTKEMYLGNNM